MASKKIADPTSCPLELGFHAPELRTTSSDPFHKSALGEFIPEFGEFSAFQQFQLI